MHRKIHEFQCLIFVLFTYEPGTLIGPGLHQKHHFRCQTHIHFHIDTHCFYAMPIRILLIKIQGMLSFLNMPFGLNGNPQGVPNANFFENHPILCIFLLIFHSQLGKYQKNGKKLLFKGRSELPFVYYIELQHRNDRLASLFKKAY